MQPEIAIVGMACHYPDAKSPSELWENVLAQRQAFRSFPPERLRIQDYVRSDHTQPDMTYSQQGAFLENYTFDRVRFHISGHSYRSCDPVHWLALDIASRALQDAGFSGEKDLPGEMTGVIVGNTLTGEFSRANSLRLRWPYVRRVVDARLRTEAWSHEQRHLFLEKLEEAYKLPFAPVGEETLAGGLSNTIAGRICNYFNFKGGGYTVDGACASSLLAVTTVCSSLMAGDIDLGLAGGVDISLDPFEIVGFAKTAALAEHDMRVYDMRSNGFLPGEGCGFVALMRYEDALAQQRRIYAVIRGWGISSDGHGGITKPEVAGQTLALKRAYKRAHFGIDSIAYFEGHGTGTRVGDTTELQALSGARREPSGSDVQPAAIGSIKANIGHTKAAAGIAGLIKATMAVYTQVIPPTTGTSDPQKELQGAKPALRVLDTGLLWPAELPLRAAVNAMGFGGINTHLVLEGNSQHRRTILTEREQHLLSSPQDAELFLFCEKDVENLQEHIQQLLRFAARLSLAELTDLAIHLAKNLHEGSIRAAIVAKDPQELMTHLEQLNTLLQHGVVSYFDEQDRFFLHKNARVDIPRVGLLFTGQGAPVYPTNSLLRRRFALLDRFYANITLPQVQDNRDTSLAQPAIAVASLAGLHVLKILGVNASVGIGHSLGEFTALHWAGAFDEDALLRMVAHRGRLMSMLGNADGKMASVMAKREVVDSLITAAADIGQLRYESGYVAISGLNTPQQTVISGHAAAVEAVVRQAKTQNIATTYLAVTQAFHSPLVSAAVEPFAACLADEQFLSLQRPVYSSITGTLLDPHQPLKALLCQQITDPVQFWPALKEASSEVDLWLEVGPGSVLRGMAVRCLDQPVVALNAGARSLKGILASAGALFAIGYPINLASLFDNRFSHTFDMHWQTHFLANPCEMAPLPLDEQHTEGELLVHELRQATMPVLDQSDGHIHNDELSTTSTLALVRQLVAERTELPLALIVDESHMLSDLHLNSITVGQMVSEAARALKLLPPVEPTQYADASVSEISHVLDDLRQHGGTEQLEEQMRFLLGVDTWVRPFQVALVEQLAPPQSVVQQKGQWELLIISACEWPLETQLRRTLSETAGVGVVVYLSPHVTEKQIGLLLGAIQNFLKQSSATHFVLLQYDGEASSLARTLFLEAHHKTVCVINLPLLADLQAVEWIRAEIQRSTGYSEAYYDLDGRRFVPQLQYLPLPPLSESSCLLGADDLLLITGGGKGIVAECAISLACAYHLRLIIFGRSFPEHDLQLQENLQRMDTAGISYRYCPIDVTAVEVVQAMMNTIIVEEGPITALLHGSGVNTPKLLSVLEPADVLQTLGPKVVGLANILQAIDPQHLRLVVTFGSVIARTGMRGEADYALANDWLARFTAEFQHAHPACRCLCIEWSIWSGIGMGERLGRVDALMRDGIAPITPDDGIDLLHQLINTSLPVVRVVASSRVAETPTLLREQASLPFLRFLEKPRIFYPQIELIVDVELSVDTDPYVLEHKFGGERLLPAVVGLEAMVQAACAVKQRTFRPQLSQIQFEKPLIIPEHGTLTLRIAALVHKAGQVDVVIRSEETAFQVDHFRLTCDFTTSPPDHLQSLATLSDLPVALPASLDLEPLQDLYGPILFHEGRFRRIHSYRLLSATTCIAEIAPASDSHLFAYYLPTQLMLADFIARDAVIHAIQACIPHATLLPIGIDHLIFSDQRGRAGSSCFVYARERQKQGDIFTYDVEVRTEQGSILEQWTGLKLQHVAAIPSPKVWKSALLVPYLERKIAEILSVESLKLNIQLRNELERRESSEQVVHSLLGKEMRIHHRADGRPVLMEKDAASISIAYTGHLTLGVINGHTVGCDLETIQEHRTATSWQDMLGPERYQLAVLLARENQEQLNVAATRTWTALESLKKAGAQINVPLVLGGVRGDGWVQLHAGGFQIVTYVTAIQGEAQRCVFAVCVKVNDQ